MRNRRTAGPPGWRTALFASAFALGFAIQAPHAAVAEWGPENTVTIVDPSPVNWLSITWNTMEELIRVDEKGNPQPALAESWKWIDPNTIEFKLRKDVTFQDGEKFDANVFRKSFDEVQKWENPHPPGAFLNFDKNTKLEVVDDYTVRFIFPETDGAAMMKFRGMHVGSSAFWDKLAFVDPETKSAEGHW